MKLKGISIIIIYILFCGLIVSCNGNNNILSNEITSGVSSSIKSSNSQLSGQIPSDNNIESYDQASIKKPTKVVYDHLMAEKNNDREAYLATISDRQREYVEQDFEMGIISLEIKEVKEFDEDDNIYSKEYINGLIDGEIGTERGWNRENMAFVYAVYDATYDHTLVPMDDGEDIERTYILARKDEHSPWLIEDQGLR